MEVTKGPSRALTAFLLALWLGSYAAARALVPNLPLGSWGGVAIALVPVIPTIGVLWLISGAVRQLDELHRRVHLEALGIAFALTILTLWTLGLLELAIQLNRDDWSYRHVWALLPMFYFIGLAFTWRRYR